MVPDPVDCLSHSTKRCMGFSFWSLKITMKILWYSRWTNNSLKSEHNLNTIIWVSLFSLFCPIAHPQVIGSWKTKLWCSIDKSVGSKDLSIVSETVFVCPGLIDYYQYKRTSSSGNKGIKLVNFNQHVEILRQELIPLESCFRPSQR